MNVSGNVYSVTDLGKVRATNEDYAGKRLNAYGQIMMVVCDGMGGRSRGDYASKLLGDSLLNSFNSFDKPIRKPKQMEKWLYKTINEVNRTLYEKSKEEGFEHMGTTLTVAILFENYLCYAQVGDSRLYAYQDDVLTQLTVDQTYVQYLEHAHKLTKEQISSHPERHKLTNAIGMKYNANVEIKTIEYNKERLLLCSDGVYNNLNTSDLKSVLKSNDLLERKGKQIINFANANGGSDNMAIVLWESH